MAGEREPRAQNTRIRLDEGVPLVADDRRWQRAAFQFGQGGLLVKQFQLAGGTRHEQVNHGTGRRRSMRWLHDGFCGGRMPWLLRGGAWCRQLNNRSRYAAVVITKKLNELGVYDG